jgi:hypothetical protein
VEGGVQNIQRTIPTIINLGRDSRLKTNIINEEHNKKVTFHNDELY